MPSMSHFFLPDPKQDRNKIKYDEVNERKIEWEKAENPDVHLSINKIIYNSHAMYLLCNNVSIFFLGTMPPKFLERITAAEL